MNAGRDLTFPRLAVTAYLAAAAAGVAQHFAWRTHDERLVALLILSASASLIWILLTALAALTVRWRALWLLPGAALALLFPSQLSLLAYSCMARLDCL